MDQNTFLYTVPQWFIFSGIIAIAYGWVEKKQIFNIVGLILIILLGVFSIYIINSGYFVFNEFLTPDEIVSQELDEETTNEIPLQAKLLPAYWTFIIAAALSVLSIFMELKNKKYSKLFRIITIAISLVGFFIIIGAVRS